jgi:hypothetical protein
MPKFELAINVDGRLINNYSEDADELSIHFNKLINEFPKLNFENMTIMEIHQWSEKWIQAHSLRCKVCKSEKFKTCHKVQLLINITEIF